MIQGVEIKELVTYADERGFFRAIVRVTDKFFDGFGQWSHSLMHPGAVKAWHIHKKQTDWWYIVVGPLKVALYDTRPDSPTFRQMMELLVGDNFAPGARFRPVWRMAAKRWETRRICSTWLQMSTIPLTKAASRTTIRRSAMIAQPVRRSSRRWPKPKRSFDF
jgi:hypothetical protein